MKYYADVFRADDNGKRCISIGCDGLSVQHTVSISSRGSNYDLFLETHADQIDAIKQIHQDNPQGIERAIMRAFEVYLCDVIHDLIFAIEDAGGHIRPKDDEPEVKAESETENKRKPVWDGTKSLPLGCSLAKIKGTYHTKLIGTAVRRGEDGMPIEKICEVDCRHDLKQADVAYDGEHIGTVTLKSNDRRLLTRAGTGVLKAYLAKIAHSSRHRHFKAEAEEV